MTSRLLENISEIPDFLLNLTENSEQTENSVRRKQEQNDLLKTILAYKDKMGYNHIQLRYLRDKEKHLEDLESHLGKMHLNKPKLTSRNSDLKNPKNIKTFYPEV